MLDPSSQSQHPGVTIGIPTMNRIDYLRLALNSALAQTYDNLEIVISNNASKDGTADYLATCSDPRVRVLQQHEPISGIDNLNACVLAARGEYFLLLSDDDMLEPDAIQEMVLGYSQFEGRFPAPGIVYCGGHIIDTVGDVKRPFKSSPERETAREMIRGFFEGKREIWLCGILYRTIDILPGFPAGLPLGADTAIWMGAVIRHKSVVRVPIELVRYRQHQNNSSSAGSIDAWRHTLWELGELAIRELTCIEGPDSLFDANLRALIKRLNVGLIPGRINQSFCNQKLKGLLEYGRRLPCFLSPWGLLILVRGILSLFASEELKKLIRKMRRAPVV